MPRLRFTPARLALVAAVALTAPAAGPAATLKWAPKPGETLKYALNQVFDVKRSQLGSGILGQDRAGRRPLVEGRRRRGRRHGRVRADGRPCPVQEHRIGRRGHLRFERQEDGRGRRITQDIAKSYEAVLGKPYTIKLSPRGEVVDVTAPGRGGRGPGRLAAGDDGRLGDVLLRRRASRTS